MGRRRRRYWQEDEDDGIFDAVIEIAKASPIAGLIIGIIASAVGSYLMWGNPKAIMGFAPLFGVCILIVGIFAVVMAGLFFLKYQLSNLRNLRFTRPGFAPRLASNHADASLWTIQRAQSLSWMEFETLIAQMFRRQGYVVEERGRSAAMAGTGDGGVDLVLSHPNTPGANYLVQVKQYKAWDVGEPKVREFYGAMAAWRTNCEGIMVTCGRYSGPAKQFAAGKPIKLIDGEGLLRMLNQSNLVRPPVAVAAPPIVQAVATPAPAIRVQPAIPVCPRCGSPMVKRVSPTGQWQPFWGCSTYPRCKAKINLT